MRRKEVQDTLTRLYDTATTRRLWKFIVIEPKGCWRWTGGVAGERKRPCFWLKGRSIQVARLMLYIKLGRPLARGRLACHTCDEGDCVNPEHLYEGTPSSNLRDAWKRGARRRPKEFTA